MRNVTKLALVIGLVAAVSASAGIKRPTMVQVHKNTVCHCPDSVGISDDLPPETGSDGRTIAWLVADKKTWIP